MKLYLLLLCIFYILIIAESSKIKKECNNTSLECVRSKSDGITILFTFFILLVVVPVGALLRDEN